MPIKTPTTDNREVIATANQFRSFKIVLVILRSKHKKTLKHAANMRMRKWKPTRQTNNIALLMHGSRSSVQLAAFGGYRQRSEPSYVWLLGGGYWHFTFCSEMRRHDRTSSNFALIRPLAKRF